MKKYTYLVNFDSQTLEHVGESFAVKGDGGIAELEFVIPSNFGVPANQALWRVFFKPPGEKESLFETLPTVAATQSGDYVTSWTISKAITQKAGRLAFSLAAISGNDIQWNSRTVIMQVPESQYQPESEEAEEPYTGRLTALEGDMAAIRGEFGDVVDEFEELKETATLGTPIPKSLASEMVKGGVYLYTGSEAGYTAGHVYYYVGGALTDGGQYGGIALDATLTSPTMAAPASEVGQIKEDLSAMQTATAEDVGKALKAKTVANGKVTEWEFGATGDENAVPFPVSPESQYGVSGQVLQTLGDGKTKWVNVSEPDPTVIENAVSDWLDEHPEATTTVADGSITEAKLATALVPTLKNDYVTPEMFGAVGDGVTDDTQAIKNMFASGARRYVFLNSEYLVTGGIDVSVQDCIVDFGDKTTLKLASNNDVRDFDYVIGFMARSIRTKGKLFVNANFAVNVGIYLSQCASSRFEYLYCNYARVWGIGTDVAHSNLGSLKFDYIGATACGYKVQAKAIATAKNMLAISDIQLGNLTDAATRSVFDYAKFKAAVYVIDDSNYQDKFSEFSVGSRLAFWSSSGVVLDSEDVTKGTFAVNRGGVGIDFVDDVDSSVGRDIFIPVGGGILIQPSGSEGLCDFDKVFTMRCPVGIALNAQYGGTIRNLASQYDTVVMISNSLALTIDYMYLEAVGTGFAITDKYSRIYLLGSNTNPKVYVNNPFVGGSRIPFYQENEVMCQQATVQGHNERDTSLICPTYLADRGLNHVNFTLDSTGWKTTVTEYSPREYTLKVAGFNRTAGITLDLADIHAVRKNRFSPFHVYAMATAPSSYPNMAIRLSDNLTNNGYTIYGAVDGVLIVDSTQYNNAMHVIIILFGKTFYVTVEPMTFVDNMQT
jgi:hypothetical protein